MFRHGNSTVEKIIQELGLGSFEKNIYYIYCCFFIIIFDQTIKQPQDDEQVLQLVDRRCNTFIPCSVAIHSIRNDSLLPCFGWTRITPLCLRISHIDHIRCHQDTLFPGMHVHGFRMHHLHVQPVGWGVRHPQNTTDALREWIERLFQLSGV